MTDAHVAKAGSIAEPAFAMPGAVPDGAALWLIRHGETAWSRSGQHTSHTDIALTEAGEREATALRGVLAELHPSLVLCSPRERARRTALLAGLDTVVDDDLVEWDYGEYEGLTTEQIRERAPGWSLWTCTTPGGETAAQVSARADRLLLRASEHLAHGPVVLVGHGHFSRVLGARWIGAPAQAGEHLLLDSACPCVLSAQYGAAVIRHWNLPNPALPERNPR